MSADRCAECVRLDNAACGHQVGGLGFERPVPPGNAPKEPETDGDGLCKCGHAKVAHHDDERRSCAWCPCQRFACACGHDASPPPQPSGALEAWDDFRQGVSAGSDRRVCAATITAALVRESEQAAEVARLTRVRGGLPGRDWLGSIVREVWDAWARQQPNPKPSWLTPWAKLSEPDKEVDRQIGETLFKLGAEAADSPRVVRLQAEVARLRASFACYNAEWHAEALRENDRLRAALAKCGEHARAIKAAHTRWYMGVPHHLLDAAAMSTVETAALAIHALALTSAATDALKGGPSNG